MLASDGGRELGWVYNSIQSRGSAIANEVKSVIASMRLLFTHLNEIRLTRVLEQQMRECRQEILDFVPQEEHLRVIQDRLVAFRVSVPLEQLRQILTVPFERKARVLSDVEIFGINHFVRRALGALNLVAVRLEGPRTIKVGIEPQDCPPEPGDTCICVCGVDCPPWYDPYCRLGDPCFALREALNIMAIMAAAYGVAALFFLPAAVIAAELVLFIAIGEYLYDQMC